MQCEMCGKEVETLTAAIIEGVEMQVCDECLPLGKKVVSKPKPKPKGPETEQRVFSHSGKLIKTAREKQGMRQMDFAKMLQIKDSTLHHIETGSHVLDIQLAKKIESALGISLVKRYKKESSFEIEESEEEGGLTLGDLLKKK